MFDFRAEIMTLKDDFVSSNKIVKVAFVIYLLAAFFSSISVTEGSWGKRQDEKSPYGSTYYRLWSVCRDDADEDLIKACFFSLIGTATGENINDYKQRLKFFLP